MIWMHAPLPSIDLRALSWGTYRNWWPSTALVHYEPIEVNCSIQLPHHICPFAPLRGIDAAFAGLLNISLDNRTRYLCCPEGARLFPGDDLDVEVDLDVLLASTEATSLGLDPFPPNELALVIQQCHLPILF